MAITELACLRLLSPTTATTPSLLTHLKSVKEAQGFFSGHFVSHFHCLEDPSTIFLVGGWPSVQTHLKDWIPSKENQDLLQGLKDEVSVSWMWHIDLDPTARKLVETAKMIAIGRHNIKHGKREEFDGLGDVKCALEESVGDKGCVKGGWRLDRGFLADGAEEEFEEGKDAEWISFGCRESDEVRHLDLVEAFDVKHAVRLEV